MAAVKNENKCDNAKNCECIDICPMGCFSYNEKTGKVEIDKSKCISCGLCAMTCPMQAVDIDEN